MTPYKGIWLRNEVVIAEKCTKRYAARRCREVGLLIQALSSKTHWLIRVHTTVLMRFGLSTLRRSKTIELRVLTSVELYAHATKQTRVRFFWSSFSFWCVFDRKVDCHTIIRYVYVFLLIHFQESFQIDALSMKTLSPFVWLEGLNASKCTQFQTKTRYCGRGVNLLLFCCFFLPVPFVVKVTKVFTRI